MRVLLLILLALTHYATDPAAHLFGGKADWWDYSLHGFGAMVLALLVALACTDWVSRGVALWIAWENFLVGACGACFIYAPAPQDLQPWENICDRVGVHVYLIGTGMLLFFAVVIQLTHKDKKHEHPSA